MTEPSQRIELPDDVREYLDGKIKVTQKEHMEWLRRRKTQQPAPMKKQDTDEGGEEKVNG